MNRIGWTLLALASLLLAGCAEEKDASKRNETNRQLTFDGVNLVLEDRGGALSVDLSPLEDDADASAENELIDQIMLTDTTLEILESENYWAIDLGALRDDADADPANELQTLGWDASARELSVSGGNKIAIPPQALTLGADGTLTLTEGGAVRVKGFLNTVVVDAQGGGAALRAAVAGIVSPGPTNRWLVRLEPGVYDLGAATLPMRGYVDLEGSGGGVTVIRSSAGTAVAGAPNAELREISIEASGAEAFALRTAGAARLRGVRIAAAANGIVAEDGLVEADGCEVAAGASGIVASGGSVRFHHGTLDAETGFASGGGGRVYVAHTRVEATNAHTGAPPACVFAFDARYAALDATCE